MAHRIPEKVKQRPSLRVLSRGTAMVPNYRALTEAGSRRFHGWKHHPKAGHARLDKDGKPTGEYEGAFHKLVDEVVEIPNTDPHYQEYVRHIKDGDLWAADPETAAAAGVSFEPAFFDEHPATSEVHAELIAKMASKVSADKAAAEALEAERKKAAIDAGRNPVPAAPAAPADPALAHPAAASEDE